MTSFKEAFTRMQKHSIAVIGIIRKNDANEITFVLIRDTRELIADYDKSRMVVVNSKNVKNPPFLEIGSTL